MSRAMTKMGKSDTNTEVDSVHATIRLTPAGRRGDRIPANGRRGLLRVRVCEFVTRLAVWEEDTLPRSRPGPYVKIWMKPPGSFAGSVGGVRQYLGAVAESADGVYSVSSGWFTEVTRDLFAYIAKPRRQPPAKSSMSPTASPCWWTAERQTISSTTPLYPGKL